MYMDFNSRFIKIYHSNTLLYARSNGMEAWNVRPEDEFRIYQFLHTEVSFLEIRALRKIIGLPTHKCLEVDPVDASTHPSFSSTSKI